MPKNNLTLTKHQTNNYRRKLYKHIDDLRECKEDVEKLFSVLEASFDSIDETLLLLDKIDQIAENNHVWSEYLDCTRKGDQLLFTPLVEYGNYKVNEISPVYYTVPSNHFFDTDRNSYVRKSHLPRVNWDNVSSIYQHVKISRNGKVSASTDSEINENTIWWAFNNDANYVFLYYNGKYDRLVEHLRVFSRETGEYPVIIEDI